MSRPIYCPGALMALYRCGFDRQQAAAAMGISLSTVLRWEIRSGLRQKEPTRRGARMSNAEFARLWLNPDISISDIADRIGVSPSAVGYRAAARGLPRRTHAGCEKRFRAITDPEFPAMYRDHVCARDLAALYGCSLPVVYRTARRMGLAARRGGRYSAIPLIRWQMQQAAMRTRGALLEANMADFHRAPRAEVAA